MTEQLPRVVWEGTFTIFGAPIKCYVLDDGRRIIDADGLRESMERHDAGAAIDERKNDEFLKWLKGGQTK